MAMRPFIPARFAAPCFRSTDNQVELLPRLRAEKLKRALYAGCDRAPFQWELRPSVHAEPVEVAPLNWENHNG